MEAGDECQVQTQRVRRFYTRVEHSNDGAYPSTGSAEKSRVKQIQVQNEKPDVRLPLQLYLMHRTLSSY